MTIRTNGAAAARIANNIWQGLRPDFVAIPDGKQFASVQDFVAFVANGSKNYDGTPGKGTPVVKVNPGQSFTIKLNKFLMGSHVGLSGLNKNPAFDVVQKPDGITITAKVGAKNFLRRDSVKLVRNSVVMNPREQTELAFTLLNGMTIRNG